MPDHLCGRPGPDCIPWSVDELIAAGVGGVISLDGPVRTSEIREAGLDHLPAYQPMLLLQSTEDQLRFLRVMPGVLEFIDRQREQGRATLIHCYYGCDRTGAALACYLVAREGLSADEAINAVQRANPEALWALGYMEVVHTYAELLASNRGSFEDARAE